MKIKLTIFGIVLLSLISFVSAHTGEDEYGHHWMMSGMYGGGWMWFGWLFGLLILIILVLLIVWLIKEIQKNK